MGIAHGFNMNIYQLSWIETPRLLIRPVRAGDEIELNAAIQRSLPALQRWMLWAKDPSLETTREFIQLGVNGWKSGVSEDFPMVVIHKENNKIIIGSGFNEKSSLSESYFEIGYWIDSDYEGQGLVSELVNALTHYALSVLKAKHVQICIQIENTRSIAVAKRCGYTCDLVLKGDRLDCITGLPADSYLFICSEQAVLPPLTISEKKRLTEIDKSLVIALLNHPKVKKHMPLSVAHVGEKEYFDFIAAKEAIWAEKGFGPWAYLINGKFIGWAGLQPDGEDIEIAIVLDPLYWGQGQRIYQDLIRYAFSELNLSSVVIYLPPTRRHIRGLLKSGFIEDGEACFSGHRFIRYRLQAPK